MKTIKLKSLALTNFKGIRSMEIEFSDTSTRICGENGTGKTTLFDAFLWLLFGKDSTWRSDSNFNIKTIGEDGKPILRLEHSVAGVLDVNGTLVKLQRNYVEIWSKPRGKADEVLKNHATEFYVNDVKLATKKEYDAEISAIIQEDVFKLITDPAYFASLKPDAQKAILFDMAGEVPDQDVARLKPEYAELLETLTGRTLIQYEKELAARIKAVKDELEVIPSQIDMANRLMPESEDWGALEAELADKKQAMAEIDAQIADKSKANETEYNRKVEIQRAIGDKRIELARHENAIRNKALDDVNALNAELSQKSYELESANNELVRTKRQIEQADVQTKALNEDLNMLRGEYRAIYSETLTYPEGAFICPTCKRPLEIEDIEAKQREMQANFNQEKARKLQLNNDKGLAKKKELEALVENRNKLTFHVNELADAMKGMAQEIDDMKKRIPEIPDVDAIIAGDATCIDLRNAIAELENQLSVDMKPVDMSALASGRNTLNDSIQELYKRLAKREQIMRVRQELESLEAKRKANNEALADMERMEFIAFSFQKDKDAELLKRINGLFGLVSFSFVREQLNGGEKLTCVCTVNGTPYPDVNKAGKLNAGLDIINAICKVKGVCAPVFIDNRESVNEIIPTLAQVVNLTVSKDKELTIK